MQDLATAKEIPERHPQRDLKWRNKSLRFQINAIARYSMVGCCLQCPQPPNLSQHLHHHNLGTTQ
ncbi:MAG: hypothetical protein AAGA60_04160 [Cyanobacteria bacterium P01_E01_bin.42]